MRGEREHSDEHDATSASRMGGSGRAGALGAVVARGPSRRRTGTGRPWRAGAGAGRRERGAARAVRPRAGRRAVRHCGAAPRGSRLLGAKARLRLRPVGDGRRRSAVVGRGQRRVRHVEVRRRTRAGWTRPRRCGLPAMIALRRRQRATPSSAALLVVALLRRRSARRAGRARSWLCARTTWNTTAVDEREHGARARRSAPTRPIATRACRRARRRCAARDARPVAPRWPRRAAAPRARRACDGERGGARGHEPRRSTARRRALCGARVRVDLGVGRAAAAGG